MEKKKILFVIDSLRGGGAEKVLTDIVKYLDKNRFEITVMTVFDGGKYVNEIKKYAAYSYVFPEYTSKSKLKKLINSIRYRGAKLILRRFNPKFIYKYAVKQKYDFEISFLEGYAATIVSGSTNKNSRKYAWIHSDLINNPWSKDYFKYQSEEAMYMRFDKIICVSNAVKESFLKKIDKHKNVIVQYNLVDEIMIKKQANELIEIDRSENFIITSIGRLEPQKSYDRLLRVHKRLMDLGYLYELWIFGEGTERKKLELFIEENNLGDTVKLYGFVKNPYKYLKRSDLFICSSLTEGFSTVATESVVLGIPVITTDCAGMNELLGDSEYGLITNNNEQDLFRGLKMLLDNPDLYQKYLEKAKEKSSQICLEKRIEEIESLFRMRVEE